MNISELSTVANMTAGDLAGKRLQQKGADFKAILDSKKNTIEEKDKQLKKACQDFEAYFLFQMFKEMDNTVMKSELVSTGRGEEMFKSMLHQEVANAAAKGKGVGLSSMMYQQMTRGNNKG